MPWRLLDIVQIEGSIVTETGLTIGGLDTFGIGGIDKQVVKDPLRQNAPYIPGSSLKGKLRSLLELATGRVDNQGNPHSCTAATCGLCAVFGPHRAADRTPERGPTRLIVRDARLCTADEEAEEFFRATGRWVDLKTENVIDRLTGTAAHPRTFERVPAGMRFEFSMGYRVLDPGDGGQFDLDNLALVRQGLDLLTRDYLGSSGSRGYGQISLVNVCAVSPAGLPLVWDAINPEAG